MAVTLGYRLAAVAFVAAMAATGASAQEPGEDETTRTGTIAEDLFLFGETIAVRAEVTGEVILMGGEVDLRSTIEGDVVAMGGDVIVDSAVSGDVLVMGGSVVSDGEIRGKLRMMGGEVINRAAVLGSLLAVGGDVELDAVSRIAGGARLAGARLMVDGIIGDDLEALGRRITVAGEIAGDTTLRGVKITILESAKIGGNLTYESGQEADIHPDAEIAGDVIFIRSEMPARAAGRAMFAFGAAWLVFVASLMLLGTVQVLLLPNFTTDTAKTIAGAPWKSLGVGLVVFIGVPVVMVILAVTVIGLSLTIVLGALYLVAAAFGYFVSAVAVGRLGARLIRKQAGATVAGRIAVLAVGLLALSIVALVPGLGPLASLAAFIIGLGALTLRLYGLRALATGSRGAAS